jgi:hypothetical protein
MKSIDVSNKGNRTTLPSIMDGVRTRNATINGDSLTVMQGKSHLVAGIPEGQQQ